MLTISTIEMRQAWVELNKRLLDPIEDNPGVIDGVASRSFYDVRLQFCGVDINGNMAAPFYPNIQKRVWLLAKRYIDTTLAWDVDIAVLKECFKKLPKRFSHSAQVRFHRLGAKSPKGGGCLSSMHFTWYDGEWRLFITSRASEVTARLLADMYFIQYAANRAAEEAQLPKWDYTAVKVDWQIMLARQFKYLVPLFLVSEFGDDKVIEFMTDDHGHEWPNQIQNHFWDVVIYPERISWAQRRKWSEKFLALSTTDWRKLKEEAHR